MAFNLPEILMASESDVSNNEESGTSAISTVASAIGDITSSVSIPEPVRRNALKAFGQLCSAAIDVPVSMLEGVAAEKRAETQARIKIITTSADQIAAQMKMDPQFAEAAAIRYGQKIVRQQVNLNRIAGIAASQLKTEMGAEQSTSSPNEDQPETTIDPDWLNHFENEASEKSTEEMQMLFGKILAGEIKRPQSFSIKTIQLISQLDSRVATTFRTLCSLSVSLALPNHSLLDVRVCSLGGNASSNSLQSYGLGFDQLNILQEYGFVISDYNSYMEYGICIAHDNRFALPFIFEGKQYGLITKADCPPVHQLRITGVALTKAGRELFPVVEISPDQKYAQALRDFFDRQGFSVVPIEKNAT